MVAASLGVVGRFWTLAGNRLTLDLGGFAAVDRPGYAKVVWDSQVTPQADGYSMSGTLALA